MPSESFFLCRVLGLLGLCKQGREKRKTTEHVRHDVVVIVDSAVHVWIS